jgi:hypothetical protein
MNDDLLVRIALLTAAIFHAEGFWVPGSLPRRNHNPGDLLNHAGANVPYSSIIAGAAAAVREVRLIVTNRSEVYRLSMTWQRVAQLWTGGDNAAAWCASVCDDLGVDPDSTLEQFANPSLLAPPQAADQQPAQAQA